MVKRGSPPSPKLKNLLCAFAVGGAFCVAAEGVKALLASFIPNESDVSKWVTIIMIFIGCALTAVGLYDDMAKFAGAGSLVPITGFANAVAAPAIEYKTEGWVTGLAVKIFTIAGPVLVYGLLASVVYGGILCLIG